MVKVNPVKIEKRWEERHSFCRYQQKMNYLNIVLTHLLISFILTKNRTPLWYKLEGGVQFSSNILETIYALKKLKRNPLESI